jgi:hypothetical protein
MGRNHLAHAAGDAANVVLAAAGYNFRRLLAWQRPLREQGRAKRVFKPPPHISIPDSACMIAQRASGYL